MNIIELQQGSPEWDAHRRAHFNASDVPAMLGISPYKTRNQLLHEYATGIIQEVDAATQRRFDDGHRFEALARPLAEKIIGEELYPVIATEDKYGLSRPLSASSDGLTMGGDKNFEHKSLNADISRIIENGAELPELYTSQMEQQHMVFGADATLFMASKFDDNDKPIKLLTQWYKPNQSMRERILAGWAQFEKDLAAYVPPEVIEKPRAEAIIDLPALSVQATGMVTYSNLPEFKAAAEDYIAKINTDLQTDQHFADAEATVKFCKATEEKLEVTKATILAQTASIDEVIRTVSYIQEQLSKKRLMLKKLVESEKEARKREIITAAQNEIAEHVAALEKETSPIKLFPSGQKPDFAGAIYGKKSLASMRNAVNDALANAKIAADAIAKDIRAKLSWCKETSAGFGFLFNDLQQIITKPLDDFKLVVTTRIEAHKAAEAKKEEDLRAKVQAEEAAKLEAERARMQSEEEAKARAKVEAEKRAKLEAALASKPVYGAEQAQIEAIGGHVAAIDISPIPVEKVAEIRHIKPARKSAKAAIMGRIEVVEDGGDNFKTDLGLLIVFETPEQLRAALANGACEFTFGEEEAAA